jgi:hypothetical protein
VFGCAYHRIADDTVSATRSGGVGTSGLPRGSSMRSTTSCRQPMSG